jgi:hypothetical protein
VLLLLWLTVVHHRSTPGHPLVTKIIRKASSNITALLDLKAARVQQQKLVASFLSEHEVQALALALGGSVISPEETLRCSGPLCLSAALKEHLLTSTDYGLLVLPTCALHPVPNYVKMNVEDETARESAKVKYVSSQSLAVHWWQSSWQ